MGFHKYSFPIRLVETADADLEVVTGWANDDYTLGFHKSYKGWTATDLVSGLRICYCETRKGCLEWIVKNEKKVEERREDPVYIMRVMEFRDLIKKELERLKENE